MMETPLRNSSRPRTALYVNPNATRSRDSPAFSLGTHMQCVVVKCDFRDDVI